MNNLIIGIAGGSGSGKTTLALRLKERFGEDEVRLISHDSYYKRHDELPFEERCKLNYDHPDALDNALLAPSTARRTITPTTTAATRCSTSSLPRC